MKIGDVYADYHKDMYEVIEFHKNNIGVRCVTLRSLDGREEYSLPVWRLKDMVAKGFWIDTGFCFIAGKGKPEIADCEVDCVGKLGS